MCGDFLKRSWKGVNLVKLFMVFMILKHILGKARVQPIWSRLMAKWIHWMTVLLVCSLAPSLSGWELEESFSFTPVSWCRLCQNCEMKSLSQSEIISKGSPFSQYHSLKNKLARPCTVREQVVGMIQMLEPSWSVMVRMQSKLFSQGRGPMKSMVCDMEKRFTHMGYFRYK